MDKAVCHIDANYYYGQIEALASTAGSLSMKLIYTSLITGFAGRILLTGDTLMGVKNISL